MNKRKKIFVIRMQPLVVPVLRERTESLSCFFFPYRIFQDKEVQDAFI